MKPRAAWLVLSCLICGGLVLASCGTPSTTVTTAPPAATTVPASTTTSPLTTAPAVEAPKYGGTLGLLQTADINWFDSIDQASGSNVLGVVPQPLWAGDWTKGIAGGYGTKKTDWGPSNNDLYDLKTGCLAESVRWTADADKKQATVVFKIRQGVHWALNPNSEASRLVAGRQLTADDVVSSLKRAISPGSYLVRANAELAPAEIAKTGPWEATVKVPLDALASALTRFGGQTYIQPPEVITKYGNMRDWKNSVGTGAFLITDYVTGSAMTLRRNPNYWMKDPIGPGQGNQLPYLDGIKVLIIPDSSTQKAAIVTGKVDFTNGVSTGPIYWEDANDISRGNPKIIKKESDSYQGRGTPMFMRTDKAPFSDVRVRKALMMAVDFNSVLNSLFQGKGQIVTWPYAYIADYADLYLGLDDPGFPAEAKALYQYNPEKSKALLKEAGFPTGFKTQVLITSGEADYYSIIKNMFGKVGVDMELNIVEGTVKNNILSKRAHEAMTTGTTGPVNNFWISTAIHGTTQYNSSILDDPVIEDWMTKIRVEYPDDPRQAMKDFKEMSKHVQLQAYVIPSVQGNVYTFWQPWLKNFSGEWTMGGNVPSWPQHIWYDAALKRSMGY